MRHSAYVLLAASIFPAAAMAQSETEVTVTTSKPPTMTAIQPVNPVSPKPGAPIIQSITAQIPTRGAVTTNVIIPEFHFIAPNGNAVLIHREMVETSGNDIRINPSAVINIPADAQKKGAVFGGGWPCSNHPYYVTMRAWIMDSDGNRSNEVQYTIHCNGG